MPIGRARISGCCEGDIGAGDEIDVVSRPGHGVTNALVARALLREPRLMAAALHAPELPAELRDWMRERAAARGVLDKQDEKEGSRTCRTR